MIELNPVVLLLFGELLLISTLVSLGLIVAGLIRKRNERRAIATLVGRIKEDEARRRGETQTLMEENFGFEGEALNSIVNKISREEKRLYQALINLFLKRDLNLLEVLHVECEGVTEPYRTIELPKPDTDKEDLESDLSSQVDLLREENERLSTELSVTMDTMAKMLKEYAAIYSGEAKEMPDKGSDENSSSSAGNEIQSEEPALEAEAESLAPSLDETQVDPGEMVVETDAIAEEDLRPDDSGMFDDAIDIDIGAVLGDETVAIDGSEELAGLDDETLVMDVNDDELVELDDEDLNFDKTDMESSQVNIDSDDQKKLAGEV